MLAMLRDQPEETADMKVLDSITLKDLDYDTIRGYRNRHMAYKPGHPWEKLDDEKYLERLGAAGIFKRGWATSSNSGRIIDVWRRISDRQRVPGILSGLSGNA